MVRIFTKIILIVLVTSLIVLVISCGPAHHIKRANHHIAKARDKGATENIDTVFITKTIITPAVHVDTLVKHVHFRDTIRIEKERVKIKVKVDTVLSTIYIDADCPPDTVRIKVPVQVTKLVATGGIKWWWLLVALTVGIIIGVLKR